MSEASLTLGVAEEGRTHSLGLSSGLRGGVLLPKIGGQPLTVSEVLGNTGREALSQGNIVLNKCQKYHGQMLSGHSSFPCTGGAGSGSGKWVRSAAWAGTVSVRAGSW